MQEPERLFYVVLAMTLAGVAIIALVMLFFQSTFDSTKAQMRYYNQPDCGDVCRGA